MNKIILLLVVLATCANAFGQKMNGKLLIADNAYYSFRATCPP